MKALNLDSSEPIVDTWLALQGTNDPYSLSGRAHRDNLNAPRPVDTDFEKFWDRIQSLLDAVTEALEAKFLEYKRIVESWSFDAPPTADNLKQLSSAVPPSRIALEPLFEKATEQWLMPLRESGLLTMPWPAEQEGTSYKAVPWPQGGYLERMASVEPELVSKILLEVPDSDNIAVHQMLAKVISVIPINKLEIERVERLVEAVRQMLEREYSDNLSSISLLSDETGRIIRRLIEFKFADQAVSLASSLFSFKSKDPRSGDGEESEWVVNKYNPEVMFDEWQYEQLLIQLTPALMELASSDTLKQLCRLLANMLELSGRSAEEDLLFVTRPAIEDHEQNQPGFERATNSLITQIRDSSIKSIQKGILTFEMVSQILNEHQYPIFKRIEMYLLTRDDIDDPERIREILNDLGLWDDISLHHEHFNLLKKRFGVLDSEDRQKVLNWLENGPSTDTFSLRFTEDNGRAPEKTELDAYRDRWRERCLRPLVGQIPEEWGGKFDHLIKGKTENDHPEFLRYSGPVIVGPQGMPEPGVIFALSDAQLLEFLESWKPSGDLLSGGHYDLGQILNRGASSDPDRFGALASRIGEIHPEFLAGVLRGIEQALRNGVKVDWAVIVEAGSALTEHPDALESVDLIEGHRNAMHQLVSLIALGLSLQENSAASDLKLGLWKLIQSGLNYGKIDDQLFDDRDALTASLNDVRGTAMRAVGAFIGWATWVQNVGPTDSTLSSEFPEIIAALNEQIGTTLPVSSAYGQMLGRLYQWDRTWLESNIGNIFPLGASNRAFWAAAWEGFLFHHNPHSTWLELLRSSYEQSAQGLGADSEPSSFVIDNLAQHIILYMIRGNLSLDEIHSDPILKAFFSNAATETLASMVRFLTNSLERSKDALDSEIIERVTQFWAWRLNLSDGGEFPPASPAELSEFGRLFTIDVLELEVAMPLLVKTLESRPDDSASSRVDDLLLVQLDALAYSHPLTVAQCLNAIVKSPDSVRWTVLSSKQKMSSVLKKLFTSGNSDAASLVVAVINRLESFGYNGFAELLDE